MESILLGGSSPWEGLIFQGFRCTGSPGWRGCRAGSVGVGSTWLVTEFCECIFWFLLPGGQTGVVPYQEAKVSLRAWGMGLPFMSSNALHFTLSHGANVTWSRAIESNLIIQFS